MARMTKRARGRKPKIQVCLPADVLSLLERRALAETRTVSQMAAIVLRDALAPGSSDVLPSLEQGSKAVVA